jgi:hypothetical protein
MGKIINFRLTQKAIYRAAVKEMEKMYQLSSGGTDPIINEASRDMFEEGQIDEVQWIDWRRYCLRVLNRIGGENLEKQ